MRIAFFGTPDFAVPTLQAVAAAGHEVAVFTQPDKPVGRKGILTPPPVKAEALKLGLPVYQFEKIRCPEGVAALRDFAPELMCVVAFGQLFSQEILDIPPYGAINIHGSLLPLYRGASPIQQTVIDGQALAGVSTMLLVKRMDAGDILLTASTPLGENETYGELSERLSHLGAELFMETLSQLEAGTLVRTPQKEEAATYCKMLTRDTGKLRMDMTAQQMHNLVRGTNPWPGAYALLGEEKLKIYATRLSKDGQQAYPVGTLFGSPREGLFLQCIDGVLELLEIQAPGGKRMDAKVFLRGHDITGSLLS